MIEDSAYSGPSQLDPIMREITSECALNGFAGVALCFTGVTPPLAALAQRLSLVLPHRNLELYVNPVYAPGCPNAKVMISTALSGGTLAGYLQSAVNTYGAKGVALNIEVARADFALPSSDGCGRDLSLEEFDHLSREFSSKSFFSQDLCLYYFTFKSQGCRHFVLYDNASSVKKKISIASEFGIDIGFIDYSESAGFLDQIVSRQSS